MRIGAGWIEAELLKEAYIVAHTIGRWLGLDGLPGSRKDAYHGRKYDVCVRGYRCNKWRGCKKGEHEQCSVARIRYPLIPGQHRLHHASGGKVRAARRLCYSIRLPEGLLQKLGRCLDMESKLSSALAFSHLRGFPDDMRLT